MKPILPSQDGPLVQEAILLMITVWSAVPFGYYLHFATDSSPINWGLGYALPASGIVYALLSRSAFVVKVREKQNRRGRVVALTGCASLLVAHLVLLHLNPLLLLSYWPWVILDVPVTFALFGLLTIVALRRLIPYVFISYARNDSESAQQIADSLGAHGVPAILDSAGALQVGDDWDVTLYERVAACSAFIVLMTPESAASCYVTSEIIVAKGTRRKLVPVLLRGSPNHLLAGVQHIDASKRDPLPELLKAADAVGCRVRSARAH